MDRPVRFASLCIASIGLSWLLGCGGSAPPNPTLTISTSSLPDGTIGTAYSQTVSASGGSGSFTWNIASGALPDNLTLASSGNSAVISGTPDQVQSGVAFTIHVIDSKGASTSHSYTVSIQGAPGVVQTQSGAVQGTTTSNGLYAFRGIPYAAPPVGSLRWKDPQPPTSWKGIRDASSFGNVCPQIQFFNFNRFVGDEDCLVLNVFVSQTPPNPIEPVMVFIHGGGNINGDTQSAPFDSPPLANHGVVVVTVEYRLGLLGFFANPLLTAEGGGSSGHYALADIIAALKWVQQNIAGFGGDPTRVMLFGESAGSWDTNMLLATPAAQGLFSVAVQESGVVPAGTLPTLAKAESNDQALVSTVGCSSAPDVLACLRAVPARTIMNISTTLAGGPGVGSSFLPKDPFSVLQQGSPVPLILGTNREEAAGLGLSPSSGLTAAGYSTAIHQRFDPFGATVANQVLTLYPASAYTSPAYALIAVDSDFRMTCEARTLARALPGSNRKPVWRYLFTHAFENDPTLNASKAFHTAELYFVFGNFNQVFGRGYGPIQAELTLSQDVMGYWTRFAATGDPNGGGALVWPTYDPNTDGMLQIDDNFATMNGYHNAQCDFLVTLPQP